MIPNIGGPELIILLVIVLLLFGAKRIPELAKGLGTGVREFRRGTSGANEEVEGEKSEKKNEDEEVLDKENEQKAEAGSDENARSENGSAGSDSDRVEAEKAEQEQRR